MLKRISFFTLVGFVLASCGGGGGNSAYTPPANSECTSSSTNICITVTSTDGGNKYAVNGTTQANITLTAGNAGNIIVLLDGVVVGKAGKLGEVVDSLIIENNFKN